MKKRIHIKTIFIILVLISILAYVYNQQDIIGRQIDSYKGVKVCNNGISYTKSHGKHFSEDGFYYGQKWQCVEFVKRFYYDAKNHKMPNVYGHAKDFFDVNVPHGELNKSRDLIQYRNGNSEKPQPDDLIVFNDTKYGHVVIVTEVTDDYIEVIQQNIYRKSREKYALKNVDDNWFVGESSMPAGWLRKK